MTEHSDVKVCSSGGGGGVVLEVEGVGRDKRAVDEVVDSDVVRTEMLASETNH